MQVPSDMTDLIDANADNKLFLREYWQMREFGEPIVLTSGGD